MAKKKRAGFLEQVEHAVSDIANALSVAATGSDLQTLELATEEELNPPKTKRKKKPAAKKAATRKKAKVARKKVAVRTSRAPARKKPAARRR